jgi:hypothetical protein
MVKAHHHRTAPGCRLARVGAMAMLALLLGLLNVALSVGPAGAATQARLPQCSTAGLVLWLDTQGSGAAGSTYYDLELTNLSGRPCTLFGYPGVSAVTLGGRQLGSAASRDRVHAPVSVALANDATATVVLQIVDVSNFPPADCSPTTAAGLRVYPPNQRAAKIVPYPFGACARPGPTFLSVEVAEPS